MKPSLFLCIFFLVFSSCSIKNEKAIQPQIIPIPYSQKILSGNFILSKETTIIGDLALKNVTNYLNSFITTNFNIKPSAKEAKNSIHLLIDTAIENEEEYHLSIRNNKILIKAKTAKGAFYGVQTLLQLIPVTVTSKNIPIQCIEIKDKPQFSYRGMHLDVGRHLFSVVFIKKYIDILSKLKINTFHWHLTEDQGWRIEIKRYPKLQEIAAYRKETLIGHYNEQPHKFDGKKYGGYYSQEEIKEVVKYASDRFIDIIPEIEMPGHSQAAIAAYPELGCTGDSVKVATKWGVFKEIYCPKETTFTFLENVIDEVVELFPSKYIHIGGDEAPKTNWKNCNHCQKLIKNKNLKDEHGLQSHFISRMEKYINKKGKQIIGWDEILEGGLAPNATVMSWRGTKGAIEAAKQKHTVILTPMSHCYFDHYQSENEEEPLAIGGYLPLKKVYSFNPIPEELNEEEAKYVLGAQGNIWTEYMKTSDKVEYMAFPRIIALAEATWSKPALKDYTDFKHRLIHFQKRLDALHIKYANHLYEIEGKIIPVENNINYQLTCNTKGKQIHYTTDNSEPTSNSSIYSLPIPVKESTIIKAASFDGSKKISTIHIAKINKHNAIGKTITLSKPPHKSYNAGGKQALINGVSGSSKRYGDKEWLGFWGDDITITIDLGTPLEIHSIATRFYNANGQWIYAPKNIEITLDNNSSIKEIMNTETVSNNLIVNYKKEFNNKKAQFITLTIPNYGVIPEGKQGSGNKAWTFIDEIIVN